jgi:predicted Zn-dependent protease
VRALRSRADRIFRREISRRDFLWLATMTTSAVGVPTLLAGCATDPVTGQTSMVGMTEQDEIAVDRQASPRQFSADYGAVPDAALNQYVSGVGAGLWTRSHRPQMPYSARVLNANYINAYTFPAGAIGVTRGIMLEVESEDELAGLLGHEIGHVNARHAAERAGRAQLASVGIGVAQIGLAVAGLGGVGDIVAAGGQIGASALLARYSRDNEREADALGMEYMTHTGYNADGMVGLMDILRKEGREKPSLIETMFSSHPMSDERYATARREAETKYAKSRAARIQRERYMDQTARLRGLRPAIEAEQRGEAALAKKNVAEAQGQFAQALKLAPNDYPGLLLMARTLMAQKRYADAEPYLDRAVAANPGEAQALALGGIVKLALKKPEPAYQRFDAYDKALPGNPSATFFKGVAMENMQNRKQAAELYMQYLQRVRQGQQAQYAAMRLREWGYLK